MADSFKKSNYVDIVRTLLPDLGEDKSTTIHSRFYEDLKHVVVASDTHEPGMINFEELYKLHGTDE